jgi:hypothetical protein
VTGMQTAKLKAEAQGRKSKVSYDSISAAGPCVRL